MSIASEPQPPPHGPAADGGAFAVPHLSTVPPVASRVSSDPRSAVGQSFVVRADARVQAATPLAQEAAGSVLYIAQLADAIGEGLGAGRLVAVEVLGRSSVVASLRSDHAGRRTVHGLVDPAGEATETLRAVIGVLDEGGSVSS